MENYKLDNNDIEPKINLGRTAADYYRHSHKSIERVSTGSKELDRLLGGGIETKAITQFYGDTCSGKTQLCHSLSTIASQDKSKGGVNGKCVYIDTEDSFRPERIMEIAQAGGFDSGSTLEDIIIYQPSNSEDQEIILQSHLPENLHQSNDKKIKLIIVDSPITHYNFEFSVLADRLQRLNRFMNSLRHIGRLHGIAIVVTNHVTTVPNSKFECELEIKKPAGGNVMGYTIAYSLYLKNTYRLRYDATLVKCPYKPNGSAVFTIDPTGITDLYI